MILDAGWTSLEGDTEEVPPVLVAYPDRVDAPGPDHCATPATTMGESAASVERRRKVGSPHRGLGPSDTEMSSVSRTDARQR